MSRSTDDEYDSLVVFRWYMSERASILPDFSGKWIPYRKAWKSTLPLVSFDTEDECWAYVDEHQIIMETLVLQVGHEPFLSEFKH